MKWIGILLIVLVLIAVGVFLMRRSRAGGAHAPSSDGNGISKGAAGAGAVGAAGAGAATLGRDKDSDADRDRTETTEDPAVGPLGGHRAGTDAAADADRAGSDISSAVATTASPDADRDGDVPTLGPDSDQEYFGADDDVRPPQDAGDRTRGDADHAQGAHAQGAHSGAVDDSVGIDSERRGASSPEVSDGTGTDGSVPRDGGRHAARDDDFGPDENAADRDGATGGGLGAATSDSDGPSAGTVAAGGAGVAAMGAAGVATSLAEGDDRGGSEDQRDDSRYPQGDSDEHRRPGQIATGEPTGPANGAGAESHEPLSQDPAGASGAPTESPFAEPVYDDAGAVDQGAGRHAAPQQGAVGTEQGQVYTSDTAHGTGQVRVDAERDVFEHQSQGETPQSGARDSQVGRVGTTHADQEAGAVDERTSAQHDPGYGAELPGDGASGAEAGAAGPRGQELRQRVQEGAQRVQGSAKERWNRPGQDGQSPGDKFSQLRERVEGEVRTRMQNRSDTGSGESGTLRDKVDEGRGKVGEGIRRFRNRGGDGSSRQ